jgi:hypothetical protein
MARPRRSLQQEIEFILLIVEPRSGASVAAAYPLLSWSVRRDWLLVATILAAIWLSVWCFWADTLRYWLWERWQVKLRPLGKMMEQQLWSREVYGYG